MVEIEKLPFDSQLNIEALSCTFNKTTTSYKFLWTLALLQNLKQDKNKIYYSTMCQSMLSIAKTPIEVYKLSLGKQDKIYKYLNYISKYDKLHDTLENRLHIIKDIGEIGEYVMYRWLTPHFRNLKNIPENKKHSEIIKLAHKSFYSEKPSPYYITEENREKIIYIHSLWRNYFLKHIGILESWIKWHFVCYLQAKNPSIPNIINKIDKPDFRKNLNNERDFWIALLKQMKEARCIFSNKLISIDNFDLDHYIPWSFVGHNQLWNLIPIDPSVNSKKNNKLPANIYLHKFVNLQHKILNIATKNEKEFLKKSITESYLSELRLDIHELKNQNKLSEAYKKLMNPLLTLATAKGFEDNWKYSA